MNFKKNIKTLLISLSLASVANLSFAAENDVIAKYKNKDITIKEVDDHFKMMMDNNELPQGKKTIAEFPDEVKENVVKTYIITLSLDESIKKDKFEPKDLDSKLQFIKDNIVRREYLISKVNKSEVESKTKKMFSERFKDIEEIKASHILVKTEEEAKKIFKELSKDAKKFEEIAKEKSIDEASKQNGGSLGYFPKGQGTLVPEFEKAASELKVNQISKPVKSKFGWHIIKVEDTRKVPAPKYDDVKQQLKMQAEAELINQEMEKIFSDSKAELLIKNDSTKDTK